MKLEGITSISFGTIEEDGSIPTNPWVTVGGEISFQSETNLTIRPRTMANMFGGRAIGKTWKAPKHKKNRIPRKLKKKVKK